MGATGEDDRPEREAIEDLRRRDVEATRDGDLERLKSLMDPSCIVFPPEGGPEAGRAYLDGVTSAAKRTVRPADIVELAQDWEELLILGGYAYEHGVVRYAVRGPGGDVVRESQRLMRILRKQADGSWKVFRAMWHGPIGERNA